MTAGRDLVSEALEAHRRGDRAAISLLERALQFNPRDGRLLIAHAEAAAMAGEPGPLGRLEKMVDLSPDWIEGQLALAGLTFELGDESRFAARLVEALRRNPGNAGLWNAYIQALVGAGQPARAADAARDAQAYFDVPVLKLIEANHASTAGQLDRASKLLADVSEETAEYPEVGARHFARTGDYAGALRLLDILRARNPAEIASWALTELLWRKTGDTRAEWLSLRPGFVSTAELGMTEAEVADLAELLRGLHGAHGRPLGQSARGGTQTRGELFRRQDPEIQKLRARIQEALDNYRQALPPADPGHPLLCRRDERWIADGGWSIRLQSSGYHVAHIHPSGLVSSACYSVVPPAGSDAREGQLEIGRAPDDLSIELEPIASITPRPGMLALFPSFLYHGTRPFGSGERLSVAFDAHCAARSA